MNKTRGSKFSDCRWCSYRAWGANYEIVDKLMGQHIIDNHWEEFVKWYNTPEEEGGPRVHYNVKIIKTGAKK